MRETSLVLENRDASEYIQNQMKTDGNIWKHWNFKRVNEDGVSHGPGSPGIQLDHPPAKKKSVKSLTSGKDGDESLGKLDEGDLKKSEEILS